MEMRELEIKGLFEIIPRKLTDNRGAFIKMYHEDSFSNIDIELDIKEQYYSLSRKNVIRGMHLQLPPHDHAKFVYCLSGSVQDVIVDIRKHSETYGKHCSLHLDSKKSNGVYIPKGFAHGFCSLEDNSCMIYNVTSVYNPESDFGILWNSCAIEWFTAHPIVSARDSAFISLKEFDSPFKEF